MKEFPSQDQFRQGAYLWTIAHAIWIARNPMFAYEVGWNGDLFLLNNSMGARGAIRFGEPFVGVFSDVNSPRNPYRTQDDYRWQSFFERASASILEIAFAEPLHYMLDDYKGKVTPIITAAIWSDNGQLTSDDEWKEVVRHGGRLMSPYLADFGRALKQIAENYQFSAELSLLTRLYKRRVTLDEDFLLTENDQKDLFSQGDAGKNESENLLKNIGIVFS
ncbi:MAG: hypothetical protein GC204_12510 [Chloroflexi bacterium]|nr:hypothetical protein [Chloroflexota bacterium]